MKDEIILEDKPAGISSFGVVAKIRKRLTEQARAEWAQRFASDAEREEAIKRGDRPPKRVKVGHAGTLDPFATGLLIILTGKATKRAGEFLKLDKEYIATVRLGATSTTGDPEGEITERGTAETAGADAEVGADGAVGTMGKIPTRAEVQEVLKGLTGEIMQKVPAYSAVKINGQRAYKLARAGKQVEMPVRKVKIYELEMLDYKWPELTIRCAVSSGTYIRALGEEIGEKLGVGGYLTALRRTQIGEYRLEK